MSVTEIFIIAVGLSMDAFAVAVCKGLSLYKMKPKHAIITGLYFGGFQALMPLIGYFLGKQFESLITSVDHWIAFGLLGIIGANMIRESRSEADNLNDSLSLKTMLPLAVATSIDALAVGITLAFLKVNIVYSVSFIGVITFVLSCVGVKIGNVFGAKYKSKAELAGGIVLILMGTKILLEHLGIINL
ncbi:MAG: manganese efflux pump [Clostridia bacterium]|nr:manganese efflux pump [Clostridia bacterium]